MKPATLAALLVGVFLFGCGGGGDATTELPSGPSGRAPSSAEASIEGYGDEAAGQDRGQLVAVFHGYLGALGRGDEDRACAYLSSRVKQSLASLVKGREIPPCGKLLEALLSPAAARVAAQQAKGEIKKVRQGDEVAFIVFTAPGARLYQLNLSREGGTWKVALISPSVLAPSLNQNE